MNLHDRDIMRMAKREGSQQKAVETAINFLKMGLTIEQVAQGVGLPPDEVKGLALSTPQS